MILQLLSRFLGEVWRVEDRMISVRARWTLVTLRPTSFFCRPRRMDSTSGNSGMADDCIVNEAILCVCMPVCFADLFSCLAEAMIRVVLPVVFVVGLLSLPIGLEEIA